MAQSQHHYCATYPPGITPPSVSFMGSGLKPILPDNLRPSIPLRRKYNVLLAAETYDNLLLELHYEEAKARSHLIVIYEEFYRVIVPRILLEANLLLWSHEGVCRQRISVEEDEIRTPMKYLCIYGGHLLSDFYEGYIYDVMLNEKRERSNVVQNYTRHLRAVASGTLTRVACGLFVRLKQWKVLNFKQKYIKDLEVSIYNVAHFDTSEETARQDIIVVECHKWHEMLFDHLTSDNYWREVQNRRYIRAMEARARFLINVVQDFEKIYLQFQTSTTSYFFPLYNFKINDFKLDRIVFIQRWIRNICQNERKKERLGLLARYRKQRMSSKGLGELYAEIQAIELKMDVEVEEMKKEGPNNFVLKRESARLFIGYSSCIKAVFRQWAAGFDQMANIIFAGPVVVDDQSLNRIEDVRGIVMLKNKSQRRDFEQVIQRDFRVKIIENEEKSRNLLLLQWHIEPVLLCPHHPNAIMWRSIHGLLELNDTDDSSDEYKLQYNPSLISAAQVNNYQFFLDLLIEDELKRRKALEIEDEVFARHEVEKDYAAMNDKILLQERIVEVDKNNTSKDSSPCMERYPPLEECAMKPIQIREDIHGMIKLSFDLNAQIKSNWRNNLIEVYGTLENLEGTEEQDRGSLEQESLFLLYRDVFRPEYWDKLLGPFYTSCLRWIVREESMNRFHIERKEKGGFDDEGCLIEVGKIPTVLGGRKLMNYGQFLNILCHFEMEERDTREVLQSSLMSVLNGVIDGVQDTIMVLTQLKKTENETQRQKMVCAGIITPIFYKLL
eukprot:Tbor_TRINITY_DN5196_c0_g1::TRINITY_DN5196_c0_g1_i1::g.25694::m.25694